MPRESIKPPPEASLIRDASGDYIATRFLLSEAEILATAEAIIEQRFLREDCLQSVADTKRFLRAKLVLQEHEQFGCLYLDNRHRVIAWEVLFNGTIRQKPVATHPHPGNDTRSARRELAEADAA